MSCYVATVPAFMQMLTALSSLLKKAEAHCMAKNIQPGVLLSARPYPDMLRFSRQIQLASDFAAKGCARLAHVEVPTTEVPRRALRNCGSGWQRSSII